MIKQLIILTFVSLYAIQSVQAVAWGNTSDPTCTTGVSKSGSLGTACCTENCGGVCGSALGNACSARPGGGEECCYGGQGNGGIFDGPRFCDEVSPPCIVRFDPFCENTDTGLLKVSSSTNGPIKAACCPTLGFSNGGCSICGSQTGLACGNQPGGSSDCCF